jgi:hypothetical protein
MRRVLAVLGEAVVRCRRHQQDHGKRQEQRRLPEHPCLEGLAVARQLFETRKEERLVLKAKKNLGAEHERAHLA